MNPPAGPLPRSSALGILLLCTLCLLLALTACGSSKDDMIVIRDPSTGETLTYKEVREYASQGEGGVGNENCAGAAGYGASIEGAEFPAGQAEFVKACEEGLRNRKSSP